MLSLETVRFSPKPTDARFPVRGVCLLRRPGVRLSLTNFRSLLRRDKLLRCLVINQQLGAVRTRKGRMDGVELFLVGRRQQTPRRTPEVVQCHSNPAVGRRPGDFSVLGVDEAADQNGRCVLLFVGMDRFVGEACVAKFCSLVEWPNAEDHDLAQLSGARRIAQAMVPASDGRVSPCLTSRPAHGCSTTWRQAERQSSPYGIRKTSARRLACFPRSA